MRDKVWNAVRSKVPEGMILPWWALTVRAVLYPLDFFFWCMSKQTGYQWQTDTWVIEGVTYSGAALRHLAAAQGETYRVAKTGETVTLERVHNVELRGRNTRRPEVSCERDESGNNDPSSCRLTPTPSTPATHPRGQERINHVP